MGYRFEDRPKPKPEEWFPVFSMPNGTDARFSVPCFYIEVEPPEEWHDYHLHDHIGWPNPRHPDHVCQRLEDYQHWREGLFLSRCTPHPLHLNHVYEYIDMDKVTPIHWRSDDETYKDEIGDAVPYAYITFDDADKEDDIDDGIYETRIGEYTITHSASVRVDEDWIIDMDFSIDGPAFNDKPQRLMLTLFIAMKSGDRLYHRQEVVRGWLEILPAASYKYIEEIEVQHAETE